MVIKERPIITERTKPFEICPRCKVGQMYFDYDINFQQDTKVCLHCGFEQGVTILAKPKDFDIIVKTLNKNYGANLPYIKDDLKDKE